MSGEQQRTAVLEDGGSGGWRAAVGHVRSHCAYGALVVPGVHDVEPKAVSQTATVTYDPTRTSVSELAGWIRDCGFHCAGASVPQHICDPSVADVHADHGARTSREAMGHGGSHAGMSMTDMVRDMRIIGRTRASPRCHLPPPQPSAHDPRWQAPRRLPRARPHGSPRILLTVSRGRR